MRRFLYNQIMRPLAFVIPCMIMARIFGLPTTWHLWVFLACTQLLDILIGNLFPYWKTTPKGSNNASR